MIEIERETRRYEGIPTVCGMMMAMLEDTGIRELIDRMCDEAGGNSRLLTTGMAVKAMIGTMFDRGKTPLYRVSSYYSTAPCDILFGTDVVPGSLSDTSLASRLDVLCRCDNELLITEAYRCLQRKYGIGEIPTYFMDGSNYTMYGMKYDERQAEYDSAMISMGYEPRESPMPRYGGNAKDNRNDLVQMNIHTVTDNDGVIMYSRPYSGNVSDIEMNRDAISFLAKNYPGAVLSADCKMCVADMLVLMAESGMRFVTKVPCNFNGRLKERMVLSVNAGGMCRSTRPGREVFDTDENVEGSVFRVVSYRLPGSDRDAERFIHGNGLKKKIAQMRSFRSRKFHCEKDALRAFDVAIRSGVTDAYTAEPVVYEDPRLVRTDPEGPHFRVRSENVRVDPSKVEDAKCTYSLQVLITNIPRSAEHSDDITRSGSPDDVVELYLQQYKSEAGFRMMKSGMNIGDVYIHTPSRIAAMSTIISLATMICYTANAVLKRTRPKGERRMTMRVMDDELARALIWYNRPKNRLTVTGGEGCTEMFFEYLDRLDIDPQYLLGYRQ